MSILNETYLQARLVELEAGKAQCISRLTAIEGAIQENTFLRAKDKEAEEKLKNKKENKNAR